MKEYIEQHPLFGIREVSEIWMYLTDLYHRIKIFEQKLMQETSQTAKHGQTKGVVLDWC